MSELRETTVTPGLTIDELIDYVGDWSQSTENVRVEIKDGQLWLLELTCSTCNGSGRVAVGPWGNRPQKETCPACNGRYTAG